MKIALTGASGGLGQAIRRVYASKDIELVLFHDNVDLDLTNREKVLENIGNLKNVDYLIHTAAYTSVDGAEKNSEEAFAVNALGSQNVALACQQNGAIPIYISTDYVFDGQNKQPYNEFDATNPINVYGRSKLAGENYFRQLSHKYFIVRTSWLFGPEGQKGFALWVYEKAKKKEAFSAVSNHIGSPTYTDDLALGLLEIIADNAYGIYHFTNTGTTTWFGWAHYILELLREKDVVLRPVCWDELNLPAARPRNSVLDNLNRRLHKLPPARPWQEATVELITVIKQKII